MGQRIILLYARRVRRFLADGALGVDMWSSEILLKLKEQPEYSDIELMIVLPHPNHDERWDKRSQARIAFLIKHCTEHITIGDAPTPESYYRRNRYLVDHADCLVAVYDKDNPARSGTGMTVNYAIKKSLPVICISPDKGTVSLI